MCISIYAHTHVKFQKKFREHMIDIREWRRRMQHDLKEIDGCQTMWYMESLINMFKKRHGKYERSS